MDAEQIFEPMDESFVEVEASTDTMQHCSQCVYSTKRNYDLKRHVRLRHGPSRQNTENDKTFLCDHCGKGYGTRYGLTLHQKDKHTLEYKFRCSTCSAGFNRLWDFRGHINKHNAVSEKCSVCGMTFQYKKSFVAHVKSQHPKPSSSATAEKDHLCSHCGMRLSCRDSLLEHVKGIHEGRMFACPKCGRLYSWRSGLNYHIKICGQK